MDKARGSAARPRRCWGAGDTQGMEGAGRGDGGAGGVGAPWAGGGLPLRAAGGAGGRQSPTASTNYATGASNPVAAI